MEIIIDNNILFALMNPRSTASFMQKELETIYAPEFIVSELEEHEDECREKSRLSKEEFYKRKEEIIRKIILVPVEIYKENLKKASRMIDDEDDTPYIACALVRHLPIWSNDPHLKQQTAIPVFTTAELVDVLF